MLRLGKNVVEELKRLVRQSYPLECGGLLAGRHARVDIKEALVVYPMRNKEMSRPSVRFEIDSKEFQVLEDDATKKGLELLAFYHSHPDTPLGTHPSDFDKERASGLEPFWPGLSWLIISVNKGEEFGFKSWLFNQATGGFEEERIEIG